MRRLVYALIFFIMTTLTACTSGAGLGPSPTPEGAFSIDTSFRDFLEKFGGEAVFGPAITGLGVNQLNEPCQFTDTVLICAKSNPASGKKDVYLYPLGPKLVEPQTNPIPMIFLDFEKTYATLGAGRVGKPISEVRVNNNRNRVEQYFENLGLYMLLDDPTKTVHLMSFGSAYCRTFTYCKYKSYPGGAIFGWDNVTEAPSLSILEKRMDALALVGKPLSTPYLTDNGSTAQVFERAILVIPIDNPSSVRFENLADRLKLPRTAPRLQEAGEKEGIRFYPVQGDLGYHVPLVFDAFIARHGGLDLSGPPISDTYTINIPSENGGGKIIRQCFENYCLDFDTRLPESSRIHLADLGVELMSDSAARQAAPLVFEINPQTTRLELSEQKPVLSSKEEQVIRVSVFQRDGTKPIPDIQSFMTIVMPNGDKVMYDMPPTGPNGTAELKLPPIPDAHNLSIIPYIVCLTSAKVEFCQSAMFVVSVDR